MNVKQGDLAVIVRSAAGNEGRLVEVVDLLGFPKGSVVFCSGKFFEVDGYPGSLWIVRSAGTPVCGTDGRGDQQFPFPDAWLRPIRPDEEPEDIDTTADREVTA